MRHLPTRVSITPAPFHVKTDDPEVTEKMYLMVFICFATKAVHLEITEGMTIADTMMALKRFIGRRGVPEALYSDNGTGLMGAKRLLCEFRETFQEKWEDTSVQDELLKLGIHWHTIPPKGPHMGGIWEALVKSAKGLLKRKFMGATLSVLQLQTAMCEIEAILNSRPLASLSEDDDDLLALTPSMLLTGFKHQLFPVLSGRKPAQLMVSKDPVQRYRYLQSLIHQFWKEWRDSYLTLLHSRQKFLKSVPTSEKAS